MIFLIYSLVFTSVSAQNLLYESREEESISKYQRINYIEGYLEKLSASIINSEKQQSRLLEELKSLQEELAAFKKEVLQKNLELTKKNEELENKLKKLNPPSANEFTQLKKDMETLKVDHNQRLEQMETTLKSMQKVIEVAEKRFGLQKKKAKK